MALPQRRCYSIERLLRGVQISSSLPPHLPLFLSLVFPPCLRSSSRPSLISSFSLFLSLSLSPVPFSLPPSLPLAALPELRFLLVVLVLVLHLVLSSSSFSSPTFLSFLFPRSLLSLPSLCLLFRVPCCFSVPFSIPRSSYPSLFLLHLSLVTRRRPPSTISS